MSEQLVALTAGPLGGTIDTVGGTNVGTTGLFLANVQLPCGTLSFSVQLVSEGSVIKEITSLPIIPHDPFPEPTSLMLVVFGVLGWFASRDP